MTLLAVKRDEQPEAVCCWPGCLCLALEHGRCSVHAGAVLEGMRCPRCIGSGVMIAGKVKNPCSRCGGVGVLDHSRQKRTPKAARVRVDDRGLIQASEHDG